ncbi:MAG: four helix bundle protein, partial [Opitutales bacterium]
MAVDTREKYASFESPPANGCPQADRPSAPPRPRTRSARLGGGKSRQRVAGRTENPQHLRIAFHKVSTEDACILQHSKPPPHPRRRPPGCRTGSPSDTTASAKHHRSKAPRRVPPHPAPPPRSAKALPATPLSPLIRSGTSPAPNYGEAQSAESRKDFVHKMKISIGDFRKVR